MDRLSHRANVKRARPYLVRAAGAGVIALTGLVVAGQLAQDVLKKNSDAGIESRVNVSGSEKTIFFIAVAVLLIAGIMAVRWTGTAIRKAFEERPGDGRGAAPAFIASVVGYLIVILSTVSVLGVNLQGLLFGGAVTGVVLGIAAQQTLGNFLAGIVLLVVRPFTVGEDVVLRSAPLGGEYSGRITDMSMFYVTMVTDHGPVALPNAGVLAAAVGPGARASTDEPDEEEEKLDQMPDPGPAHGGTPQ